MLESRVVRWRASREERTYDTRTARATNVQGSSSILAQRLHAAHHATYRPYCPCRPWCPFLACRRIGIPPCSVSRRFLRRLHMASGLIFPGCARGLASHQIRGACRAAGAAGAAGAARLQKACRPCAPRPCRHCAPSERVEREAPRRAP